jgi:4-hydroxyacetophenone monooxygenase
VTAGLPAASDDDLRAAVADAELPPLLAALAHLTGRPLPAHLRPPTISRLVPQGGYSEQQQHQARVLATDLLAALRDGAPPDSPAPPDDQRARLLETVRFLVGDDAERYLPLLMDEVAATADPDAPAWRQDDLAPGRPFGVGAGMSGLVAAYRLGQAGVPYTIIEKNDDVGGTWLENSYPGCRVDVSNHLYSYSFWPKDDWPQYFSTGDVLLDYFRLFADEHEITEHIRFGSEVVSLKFDEDACTWAVQVRGPGGEELITAQAVITAVGQLNRPSYPAITGRRDFAGPSFHSARWDHGVDLRGKRVAVIGTGASAFQFVPEIAGTAGRLTIFQRTPPWLGPTPDYHDPVAAGLQWLLRSVPSYAQWYRFWLFCSSVEGMLPSVHVDPDWPVSERSVSAANDDRRAELTRYLERIFAGRPDLLEAAIPGYPPGAKRMLRDNGAWAAALRRTRAPDLRDYELL